VTIAWAKKVKFTLHKPSESSSAPPSDCDKHAEINKFGSTRKEQRKRPNSDCHCSVRFSGGRVLLSSHSQQVHCPRAPPRSLHQISCVRRLATGPGLFNKGLASSSGWTDIAMASDRCVTCAFCELGPEALTRHDHLPATATHASAPGELRWLRGW
jgi:hypothetical protein